MHSTINDNKTLVRRYFEVIGAADLDGIGALMDPKLRFRCAGGTGFEDSVVFNSPETLLTDIRHNLGKLYDPDVGLNPEILNMTAEENRVVTEVRIKGKSAVSGEIYDNLYVFLFWIRDGKFVEIHEHLDTAYAGAKLLGPAGFATGADLPWLEES
ncbi:MAG: ketosteroid isomerase-like protein [Hyphomicrobiaceae bacterium]|jgi:ketosteroid isomerase-like protein